MNKRLIADAWRMLWPLLLSGVISYSIEQWWPLVVMLVVLLSWQVWQKWRLARWLARGELLQPPHAGGLWEEYYTRLMHLFRHEQRAQLELSDIIERVRKTADSLDEGVVLLATDYSLVYYNRAACDLLGLVQMDRGERLTNLVRHPELQQYLEDQSFHEALVIPSAWKKIMLSIKLTSLASEGYLVRVEDVTSIQKLENLRRDFVANVSHELKTPITVFKGSLELLLEYPSNNSPQYLQLLEHMQQQCERMESLVGDLLLLAKLEGHKSPQMTSISINALCGKLEQTFAKKAAVKQQRIEWDIAENLALKGVPDEIESAFSNLVDNAINYTPLNGVVKVSCHQSLTELIFTVKDNGSGIDEMHIPHLTERFYRVDKSRGRGNGATGLGLAIVKHVLNRHKGSLSIQSKLGEGSSFSCRFPITND